jgi:hypothetical protein
MYRSAAAEPGIVPPELGISATQRLGFIFVPGPLRSLCLARLPKLQMPHEEIEGTTHLVPTLTAKLWTPD